MISFNHVGLYLQQDKKIILEKVSKIIDAGTVFDGDETALLLANLTGFLGDGLMTITASGHDALLLSLRALSLSATDEVIFPVNAYPTAFPIAQSGAKPVPADIDDHGQLNPDAVERLINDNTRAIVIVHLYGLFGQLDQIQTLCRKRNIILIEDCAQAFGARYRDRPVGILGDIGCFSFYPTKNIGTLGDGGAIFTRNKTVHAFLQKAVMYGERFRYMSELYPIY